MAMENPPALSDFKPPLMQLNARHLWSWSDQQAEAFCCATTAQGYNNEAFLTYVFDVFDYCSSHDHYENAGHEYWMDLDY